MLSIFWAIPSTIEANGVAILAQAQPIVLRANPASLAAMVNLGSLGGKTVDASAIIGGGKGACPWSTGKDSYKGGMIGKSKGAKFKGKGKDKTKGGKGKGKVKGKKGKKEFGKGKYSNGEVPPPPPPPMRQSPAGALVVTTMPDTKVRVPAQLKPNAKSASLLSGLSKKVIKHIQWRKKLIAKKKEDASKKKTAADNTNPNTAAAKKKSPKKRWVPKVKVGEDVATNAETTEVPKESPPDPPTDPKTKEEPRRSRSRERSSHRSPSSESSSSKRPRQPKKMCATTTTPSIPCTAMSMPFNADQQRQIVDQLKSLTQLASTGTLDRAPRGWYLTTLLGIVYSPPIQ